MRPSPRILLVDPNDAGRSVLAERLTLQGFSVKESRDGADGAIQALEDPPETVVADLSMPSISGVQLCRLLRSEGATSKVPVVLRGGESRRNRFWAEQAGAFAYVVKGRMGELVRTLRRAIERHSSDDSDFFVVASTEGLDVRDRIATHLDAALFDSVIASEVRRLGTCESFDRLVDLLSQCVSQVMTYRWMAVLRSDPPRVGVHANPSSHDVARQEACEALKIDATSVPIVSVSDEDATAEVRGATPVVAPIHFGEATLGALAMAPLTSSHAGDAVLIRVIARELGGALRMATLVEESRALATTDPLTGLMNRRALLEWGRREVLRATRYQDSLSLILLDVDHFKSINDRRGHNAGDAVLVALGRLLGKSVRSCDIAARWGGEEFIVALPSTPLDEAVGVAERLREGVEAHEVMGSEQSPLRATASFGVAPLVAGETLEQVVDKADRAMYAAKTSGRNRVCVADDLQTSTATRALQAVGA